MGSVSLFSQSMTSLSSPKSGITCSRILWWKAFSQSICQIDWIYSWVEFFFSLLLFFSRSLRANAFKRFSHLTWMLGSRKFVGVKLTSHHVKVKVRENVCPVRGTMNLTSLLFSIFKSISFRWIGAIVMSNNFNAPVPPKVYFVSGAGTTCTTFSMRIPNSFAS